MRVFINTLPLYDKGQGGLRTYALELLRALHQSNADMEWHVLLRHNDRELLNIAGDKRFKVAPTTALMRLLKIPVARFAWRHISDQTMSPLIGTRCDVVHYLDSYGPMRGVGHTPLLLTIHDLIPLMDKPYFSGWAKAYMGTLMRRSIPRADFLMVDSEVAAQDLRELLGIPSQRMMVVPIGVSDSFHPSTPEEHRRVVERYHLTAPTVVYVGSIMARKNIARLIRAFARAKRDYELPHHLVLAGKIWDFEGVQEAIDEVKLGNAVRHLGYIPKEDMAPLIAAGDVMAYISLDEGFGLPVVEAMACGTPVLTSNVSSLREVAGNAAVLVDPYDENAIATALARLCTDDKLRTQLRADGLAHARRYRWSTVAETAITIYQRMAARQPLPFTIAMPDTLDETMKRNAVQPNT